MFRRFKNRPAPLVSLFLCVLCLTLIYGCLPNSQPVAEASTLLTEPFLQLPTENSVRVVWFSEFPGEKNTVAYGENLKQTTDATTIKLSHTREDQQSRVGNQTEDKQVYQKPVQRDIWRHEAEITGLTSGNKIDYQVTSKPENGGDAKSKIYNLTPAPESGKPLKILLTSDHQLKPMTAANLQKAKETAGNIDAVFMAGDLVNISDRASEWFDDNRGGAFFPALQGRASYEIENGVKTAYTGGEIIQNAPLFTAIGNHEVMGRRGKSDSLGGEYNDTIPRAVAKNLYGESALSANSFNTDTYEEIFSLPESKTGGEKYYATTFGDVRLVVLYATNIWRVPNLDPDAKGKYRERAADFDKPENWGYGQHLFEPIDPGSAQYNWLVEELNSPEFQQAKYKIVMFHHPVHSLGENIVPAYTNPVQTIEKDDSGKITAIRYEYPIEKDYLIRDIVPLLEKNKVQLVFYGHSHLWNRFRSPSGMHFLESSNVGNNYGAYVGDKKRNVPQGYKEKYIQVGDPNGLEPIMPSIKPLTGEDGKSTPYIASNEITVFSILDTGNGEVSSYYFDTTKPGDKVIKFDNFKLK
ncbi:metallophosphoesterase family protein [Rivularia sp. UHCC 0363]|uniref:metallophosphoesterase family protein n=1 Tax=Rivularia sp. UHCC 0363 TaxID=3110244 RepID=UPI002B1F06A1|nr:metallophosphoesterase family protein [Rivularia sp. UHCC 0363]MEA5594630.1 metallophosphoesterase family protein [Rivularia sp. UHCC 0363]